MPRDNSGNYTLPAGNPVESGTIISPLWANPTMEDVGEEITNSLDRSGRGGMLVPFQNVDGILGAPGITWSAEASLGFYRPHPNEMRATVSNVDSTRWINASLTPIGAQEPFEIWDGQAWRAALYGAGGAPNLDNNIYATSTNFAGDGFINLIKGNIDDTVELGANTSVNGNLTAIVADAQAPFTSRRTGSPVLAGEEAGRFQVQGISDLAGNSNLARIRVFAETDVVSGALSSSMRFETATGVGLAETMRIDGAGNIDIPIGGITVSGGVTGDLTGNADTATSALTAGSATTAGTVTVAAQPVITSVGTLAALTVTAAIVGSVTGSAATATSATTAGTVTTPAQPAITSVGVLAALTVTAAIVGSVTGSAGTAGSATTAGTVTAPNQTAITQVGTLIGLAMTGALTVGTDITATGNVTAFSDARLKDNQKIIPNALAKVNTLSGYTYTRNDLDGRPDAGLIAQEVQAVLPEAVTELDSGILGLNSAAVIGLLVESSKELTARVQELESS